MKTLVKKVRAKLDAQKIYESKKVYDLMNKGTELYPEYNLNKKHTQKVIEYVFKNIPVEQRTKELADKIEAGIT